MHGGGGGGGDDDRSLRSKGLLPALAVGGTVYFVTGVVSLGTLALVGVGAGVGYGVGSWVVEKFQKKNEHGQQGVATMDQLPWAVQVALQQWQGFVAQRVGGRQVMEGEVDQLWLEFEQLEPVHAANARPYVRGNPYATQAPGAASGGARFVPTAAAEV
mmetsp:Transcript_2234/g.4699  ORF Transcript_2234/g.4699 Transcript_2234/m.4699 type:complete len:159 (-) Transcript_2234:53-529(-)